MKSIVFFTLVFVSTSLAQFGGISAHWDIFKQTPIVTFIYQQPIGDFFLNGFVDFYPTPNVPDLVFPANKSLVFSKHWLAYPITKNLSFSTEIQVMYNVPDAWGRSPRFQFRQDKLYVMPKIGVMYRLW
jgi:hypothetical protein